MPILDPSYGQHPDHPDAPALGDRVAGLELPLADGGQFILDAALGGGPVILAWVGGAEHEALMTWVQVLDASVAQFDARGATVVFVRPSSAEGALRWAVELGLQSAVAGDPDAQLAARMGLCDDAGSLATTLDFAVLIVDRDGGLRYRKLGQRRPELDELLAVLDGAASNLRCCPGSCVGASCE